MKQLSAATRPAGGHAAHRRNARPTFAAQYLGIAVSTLWRWTAERHDFPKPRKIGPRATVWDLNEIDAWLDAQQSK